MSTINSGDKGVWLDANGLPVVGVVAQANVTVGKMLWQLVLLKPGRWQLRQWWQEDGKKPVPAPGDNAFTFSAKTKAEAEKRGLEIMEAQRKKWRDAEAARNAFTDIPVQEHERWLDAWMKAHESEWPNLFNVRKGRPVHAALVADLIAMGFEEKATEAICKLVVKTKLSPTDKLNVWLVANWFHGEKLANKTPDERLTLVRESYGLPHATLGMVKQRLSRSLALTHRNE